MFQKLASSGQRRSTQLRLSVLVVTLLAVTCLGLPWIAKQNQRRALEAEIEKRGLTLAASLASGAAGAMLEEDDLTLRRLLERASGEEGVVAARLLEPDGRVRDSLVAADAGWPLDRSGRTGTGAERGAVVQRSGDLLLVAAPTVFADFRVGEAQVVLDLAHLVEPVVQESTRQLTWVAVAVLLVGLLAGLGCVALFVGPAPQR